MNKELANHIANRVLYEAMPDTTGPGWKDGLPLNMKVYQDAVAKMTPAEKKAFDAKIKTRNDAEGKRKQKAQNDFWDSWKHEILQIASVVSLFTPLAPIAYPILSAMDAAEYVKDGDREGAMLSAAFAMIPGVGKLGKAAAIEALGVKGMAMLGARVAALKAGKQVALSNAQKAALKLLSGNKKAAEQIIKARAQKFASSKAIQATRKVGQKTGKFVKNVGIDLTQDATVSAVVNKIYTASGWEAADIAAQVRGASILAKLK